MSKSTRSKDLPLPGPYVYKDGPPRGAHWLKKPFGLESIVEHKYVVDTEEYLFKVRWQRCEED
jgi:hypothetical protein